MVEITKPILFQIYM